MKRLTSVLAADSTNVLVQNIAGVPQESLNYINDNVQLVGTFVNGTTITFNRGWVAAPSGFPVTSIDNFAFFCNGLVVEKSSITSFTQSSEVTTLVINAGLLGYSFSNTDEVVAVGKFTS